MVEVLKYRTVYRFYSRISCPRFQSPPSLDVGCGGLVHLVERVGCLLGQLAGFDVESREKRGHAEAVPVLFDTDSTWNLHVDEKHRRELPGGSARVKVVGAPGAYEVDWWSPEPGGDWEPVERGEFDDVEEPAEVSHLA